MSSRIDVDEIRSKTTNGNLVVSPNGTGIFVPKRVPSFYAYNSAGQSFADVNWTRVTLPNTVFDTCGDFNTSNNRFVAPVNGIYSFTTALNYSTNTAASGYVYADVRKNGTTQYYTMGMRLDGQIISNDTQINGSILLPLDADDYVEMGVYQDVDFGVSPSLNAGRSYLTGHLVSGT